MCVTALVGGCDDRLRSAPGTTGGAGGVGGDGGAREDGGAGAVGPGLAAFLPSVPAPTGEGQRAFAGRITEDNAPTEVIPGSASVGHAGDLFLRNDRIRVVIQREGDRDIGPSPYGGNIVDADLVGEARGDRFGELSLVYTSGRTLDLTSDAEILADGARGGVAAIRIRGRDAPNDFIHLSGAGLVPIPSQRSADLDLGLVGAVTYVLEPGADHVRVLYTLYNPTHARVDQPIGTLSDSGAVVSTFAPGDGFGSVDLSKITSALENPVPYQAIDGTQIAYGIVPLLPPGPDGAVRASSSYAFLGVSIVLFGITSFLDLLDTDKPMPLALAPGEGATFEVAFVVGKDGAAIEERARALRGEATGVLSGRVTDAEGQPAAGVRVMLFTGDPAVAASKVRTFATTAADGRYRFVTVPGDYHVFAQTRRELPGPAVPATVRLGAEASADLTLPAVAVLDYVVTDADTGRLIPARITVIGDAPELGDKRRGDPYDRATLIAATEHTRFGTSVSRPDADGTDAPLRVVAGRSYRVVASRGPEWTNAHEVLPALGAGAHTLSFALRHVVDSTGYVATDFHQHQEGSPDAWVENDRRVRTYLAEGIDFFASSDHDVLTDFQPYIAALRAEGLVATVVGVEATPFDYGHFGAFPLQRDASKASGGAVDWRGGRALDGLMPGELFEASRQRGARIVQVNHPRVVPGGRDFQAAWDRAGLRFDFARRSFGGDAMVQPFPNVDLRLPADKLLFSDRFDTFELWNGFRPGDADGDGVREDQRVDLLLRDFANFLAFGFRPFVVGNSDSHTALHDPAGMPRSYVRVPDDSARALADGSIAEAVYRTLRGEGVPKDGFVSNGPFIRIAAYGDAQSGIGSTVRLQGDAVSLHVAVQAVDWVHVDTVEVFANATFDKVGAEVGASETAHVPLLCYSARTGRRPGDACSQAFGGVRPLALVLAPGKRSAELDVSLPVSAVPHRQGGTSNDFWILVRVSGQDALWPEIPNAVVTAANQAVLIGGTAAELDAALRGTGVPAMAITNPLYVDVDGDGFRAPFAP